jgi:hypothetical protein
MTETKLISKEDVLANAIGARSVKPAPLAEAIMKLSTELRATSIKRLDGFLTSFKIAESYRELTAQEKYVAKKAVSTLEQVALLQKHLSPLELSEALHSLASLGKEGKMTGFVHDEARLAKIRVTNSMFSIKDITIAKDIVVELLANPQ